MKARHIFILLFLTSLAASGQSNKFSKEAVLEDFKTLRESLHDAHYNLYAYTSKQVFDSAYSELKSKVAKDSLDLLETTNLFQQLISLANNGHTEIGFPAQPYIQYASAGGTVFPLEVAFEGNKALVRKNWSNDSSIVLGSKLVSINGVSMADILQQIYPQVSAERLYFKHAKIELYSLPRYYWQVFGQEDEYEIEIRIDDQVEKHTLKAIKAIEGYEMKRTEVINAQMKLEFFNAATYLNPGGFGGDETKYRRFIDSAFAEIKAKNINNLIIDLRNNPGGDDAFSDYMVSYIADQPFKWNSKFTLKTSQFLKEHVRNKYDTTEVYWQQVLAHEDGEVYEHDFDAYQPQPIEKRFTGKVYVLVNRQSHSQSAVTAAQIQDYQFGTLVGEETGDYPSLYASVFQYPLPRTGVMVQVSKGYMVRVNGSQKEVGVIPDIYIKDQLLDEKDEILDGLMRIIEGDKK